MYVCMYVCMYLDMHIVCVYVCVCVNPVELTETHACAHSDAFVPAVFASPPVLPTGKFMYVCMYLDIYIYIYIYI